MAEPTPNRNPEIKYTQVSDNLIRFEKCRGGEEVISFLLLLKIRQEKGCYRMCTDLIFLTPIFGLHNF